MKKPEKQVLRGLAKHSHGRCSQNSLSAEELATRTIVDTIRNNTDRNQDLLVTQINEMSKDWERMSSWVCKINQACGDGLKVNLQIKNLLKIIFELQEQVLFARAIVTNLGYVLGDALVSLSRGILPSASYRYYKLGTLCQRWNKLDGSP